MKSRCYNWIIVKEGKKMKKWFQKIMPEFAIVHLAIIIILDLLVYRIGSMIGRTKDCWNMSLPIDEQIPFVSWMVAIYLGCYLFWIVNYVMACNRDKHSADQFLVANILGLLICFICFVFLPCSFPRAEIIGKNIFDRMVALVYRLDEPVNLFPSLHCYASMMCYLGIKEDSRIPDWYKTFSYIFAIIVSISTVLVKQHVIVDGIAGVLLAYLTFSISQKIIVKIE